MTSARLLAVLVLYAGPVHAHPQGDPDAPQLTVQSGHFTQINDAIFSVDSSFLVTVPAPSDGMIASDMLPIVWDVETGKILRRLQAFQFGGISSIAMSFDGQRVLTGSWEGEVLATELETGAIPFELEPFDASVLAVGMAMADDPVTVVTADGVLRQVDPNTLEVVHGFEFGTAGLDRITPVLSRDGQWLLAPAGGTEFGLWDIAQGIEVLRFDVETENFGLSIDFEGSWIAAGTLEGQIYKWDAPFDVTPTLLEIGVDASYGKISNDGSFALVASPDSWESQAWSFTTLEMLGVIDGTPLVISPDSLFALTTPLSELEGVFNNTVLLHDVSSGEPLMEFRSAVSPKTQVAASANGDWLATGDQTGEVNLWLLAEGQPVETLHFWSPVTGLSMTDDGRWMAISVQPPYDFELDEMLPAATYLRDGWEDEDLREFPGAASLLFPGGEALVTGDEFGIVQVWGTEDGEPLVTLEAPESGGVFGLSLSEDGVRLAVSYADGLTRVWHLGTGLEIARFEGGPEVDLSPNGELVVTSDGWESTTLWSVDSPLELQYFEGVRPKFTPDGSQIATVSDNTVVLWDPEDGQLITPLMSDHTDRIQALSFAPTGPWLWTASKDGTVGLIDLESQHVALRLMNFELPFDPTQEDFEESDYWVNPWAVVDSEGRYDAAYGGEVDGLHWVYRNEVIELDQLKGTFYDPTLLAKILFPEDYELRDVVSMESGDFAYHPKVEVLESPSTGNPSFRVAIESQWDSGIGSVVVFVNGIEFLSDARDPSADSDVDRMEVRVDLSKSIHFEGDGSDRIEVYAYNENHSLFGEVLIQGQSDFNSRGGRARSKAKTAPVAERGDFHALIVGVSNYEGSEIDLQFAARDARAFGKAITTAATRFHGAERVHVEILDDQGTPADREAIDRALGKLANVKRDDTVLIYLSGHGITVEKDYLYLLRGAASLSPPSEAERSRVSLSGEELTARLKAIPALRRALILDTCSSGKLIETMHGARGADSNREFALERLKDRTGTFVLAGSAADMKSYESNRFGQGLLTYSLLLGMSGAALREDVFVDVEELFRFAVDQVPDLARGIPGSQLPQIAVPVEGAFSTFDIGELQEADRKTIQLPKARPLIMKGMFFPAGDTIDGLGLTDAVHNGLREHTRADNAAFSFVPTDKLADAYQVAGFYVLEDDLAKVDVFLNKDGERVAKFPIEGPKDDLDALVDLILKGVIEKIQ